MPIEIIAVERVDGRRTKAPRDTLTIARLIMDECVPGNAPTPADELALMVLLEGAIDGGLRVGDIVKSFGYPPATIQGVIRRAEAAGRVVRVRTGPKTVYVQLTQRGIHERRQRRGATGRNR